MGKKLLKKIKIIKLKVVKLRSGNIVKILKRDEIKNWSFGEAYFSKIKFNKIKAWKCHKKMTLNLVVTTGNVKFVFFDKNKVKLKVVKLNEKKSLRLSVPPNIWFGFKGMSRKESTILNLANIKHNPNEVLQCDKNKIKFNWSK